jgi:hypothetical protein
VGRGTSTRWVSAVIDQIDRDGKVSKVREIYEVGLVIVEEEQSAAVIVSVRTEPESFVDLDAARTMLKEFLEALAGQNYEDACCLSDAGYLDELVPLMGEEYVNSEWGDGHSPIKQQVRRIYKNAEEYRNGKYLSLLE